MPIHRQLDDELKPLAAALQRMTDLVDEQFANAVQALLSRDLELAEQVIQRDDVVDALELKIDDLCERILARHHPVAADLRMLITAVKINTDLERIGDHCKNLARNAPHVEHEPEVLACTQLKEMVDASRAMLRKVQDAFLNRDHDLAREVIAHDEKVNRLHRENFQALVNYCKEHPEKAAPVAHMTTASKALGRLGDHTKNIAESVIFLIEGKDVRHRSLQHTGEEGAA